MGRQEAAMTDKEFLGFEDLECYQLGRKVFEEAYRVAGALPACEKYNLSDQLRRAGTSIVLNIAEAVWPLSFPGLPALLPYCAGSIMEVQAGFIASDDLGYTKDMVAAQRELCHSALRSLNGYIRYVRHQQQGQQEYGDRVLKEKSAAYDVDQPSLG